MVSVAGIDRWRGGWIVAEVLDRDLLLWAAPHISDVTERLTEHAAVAIDMPIALAIEGRRQAESELRSALGSSSRSVFTSPTRSAVVAPTHSEATEINRRHDGPGISAQAYGLFASIVELRDTLAGSAFNHWWETHPETSFAAMNAGTPLASKKSARGVGQRLALLRSIFPTIDELLATSPEKVPADDVLDAVAAAWSARRIATGSATIYGPAARDDEGFALGIRV